MKTIESQNDRILKHLLKGHSISWLTAAKQFGCASLHRRLADLRSGYKGKQWPVNFGEWVEHNEKRYKVYSMERS